MTTFASSCSEGEPFGFAAGWRGAAAIMGMALLLAGCGQGQNASSKTGATPAASATKSAPASVPAMLPAQAPTGAASTAQVQQVAAAAKTKLASMSVSDLLSAAREAYAQHRLVAPAGNNAMEYYEAVLAQEPNNEVARDALRETFPFGVPDVEKAISQSNFDEASREIEVLAKADPTNYTLTLLRSKLDAQKKLQARQQQETQLKAQKASELAAQQAAAAKAEAEKKAAAKLAAQQQTAPVKPAPPPEPVTVMAPPKPAGITRAAKVLRAAAPQYPFNASRNQISGYAVVEFTVEADGSVQDTHIVDSSPPHVFDRAAIEAVIRSKYQPALKDGQPMASIVRRRMDFRIGG